MNRNEFINELKINLQGLPFEDIQDILSDYEEHFDVGLSKGKSEDEIAKELGEPREIADGYRSNFQGNYQNKPMAIEAGYRVAEVQSNANDNTRKFLLGLLLIIVNLIILIGPFMAIIGVLIGLYCAGIGVFLGGIGLMWKFPFSSIMLTTNYHFLTTLGFGIGLGALGVLIVISAVYLTKLLYKLMVKYIKWNIKLINE